MPPIQLIATKRLTYGTRRLSADDIFTARTSTDARALIAVKRAKPYTAAPKKPETVTPKPKPTPKKAPAKRAAKKPKPA